ncbi:hypothetical protein K0M31_002924 [Melipona bicolor]|uniref:Uncharacterized protein n=1 Tax=Melipona bicolor TaxID=60889 RepID=A0AA40G060_9HYME|nr:hypothetical protein K0M31_002924 [Melipona bicolor]
MPVIPVSRFDVAFSIFNESSLINRTQRMELSKAQKLYRKIAPVPESDLSRTIVKIRTESCFPRENRADKWRRVSPNRTNRILNHRRRFIARPIENPRNREPRHFPLRAHL